MGMPRLLDDLDECVGKTVEAVDMRTEVCCLWFTDGTAVVIGTYHGEDNTEIRVHPRPGDSALLHLGLINKDEYLRRHEVFERREYERLRAKFEARPAG